MTEHKDPLDPTYDQEDIYAPDSLLPSVLERLGLNKPRATSTPVSLEILRAKLTDPIWTTRVAAINELATLHDPETLALLFAALRDEDPAVRASAVRVLGTRGNLNEPATLAHLEAALLDPDWHVHETALFALKVQPTTANPAPQPGMPHTYEDKSKETIMVEDEHCAQKEHILTIIKKAAPVQVNPGSHQTMRKRPASWLIASGMVAILVLSLVTVWFAQMHLLRFSTGNTTTNITTFSDANALQLGAPLYSFQSNIGPLTSQSQIPIDQTRAALWSTDSHFFSSLEVNSQGNRLQVRVQDMIGRQAKIYPVLDSSWIPDAEQKGTFSFNLVGNDLIASRPQDKNSRALVIWDISGQHILDEQRVPTAQDTSKPGAYITPFVIPTQDKQKFALYSPGIALEIWNTASGQRLVTCQSLPPLTDGPFYTTAVWSDNNQELTAFSQNGHLQAWNANTGQLLFSQNDPTRTYYGVAISPDSRYLMLESGPQNAFRSTSPRVENVIVLDASTGRLLHTDRRSYTWGGFSLDWLPDSHHLRILGRASQKVQNNEIQILIWDAFTDREILNKIEPAGYAFFSRDSQYLVLGNANHTGLKILQSSDGHEIANLTTPNYAMSYKNSNLMVTSKNVILLQENAIYVWSVLTGQLQYKYHGSVPYLSKGIQSEAIFLSPDGRYLVMISYLDTRSNNATTTIWALF